jgi:hypothetical protein
MTNSKTTGTLSHKEVSIHGTETTKPIPRLTDEEAYPSLGIWLSITGAWQVQQQKMNYTVFEFMNYLTARGFTVFQTVTAINRILIPALEYRLQVAELNDKVLKGWNKRIAHPLIRRMGWYWKDGSQMAFLPQQQGGLGLTDITEMNVLSKVSGLVSLGMNGQDPQTIESLTALQASQLENNQPTSIEKLTKILRPWKLTIQEVEERTYKINSIRGAIREHQYQAMERVNLTKASDYVHSDERLYNHQEFLSKHQLDSTQYSYQQHSGINKELRKGTLEEDINISALTPYTDGSYGAELYAVWLALKTTEKNFDLRIYADNKGEIKKLERAWNGAVTEGETRKDPLSPLIEEITRLRKERFKQHGTRVEIIHVYSHSIDYMIMRRRPNPEEIRRLEAMKKKFGNQWYALAKGNQAADHAAKEALNQLRPLTPQPGVRG